MVDINIQIQNAKFQLNSIQSQFASIEKQIQTLGAFSIGSQINSIALQLLNTGIQMLFIGIQFPNMNINEININEKIENLKNQLHLFQMRYSNINNFNNDLNNIPFQAQNMNLSNINETKKMNIFFRSQGGSKRNIICEHGTTIREVLEKYLNSIDRSEFINNNSIFFICTTGTLKGDGLLRFDDETKIEDYFREKNTNIIEVTGRNVNW